MEVLDQEDGFWFLLRKNQNLFLDINCSHSFVSYSFLLQLDEHEALQFSMFGHPYIQRLAEEIQFSAPAVIGSNSAYKHRNVHDRFSQEILAAIQAFRVAN